MSSSLLHILLVFVLVLITVQDFKDRKVTVLLFMLSGVLLGYLHFINTTIFTFLTATILNLSIISIIILVLRVYARLKLKKALSATFGIGDGLFFIAMALGFPTATFIVLFSFSLLFTLLIFYLIKKNLSAQTVPLAGLQSLFLVIIFFLNPVFKFVDLYTI